MDADRETPLGYARLLLFAPQKKEETPHSIVPIMPFSNRDDQRIKPYVDRMLTLENESTLVAHGIELGSTDEHGIYRPNKDRFNIDPKKAETRLGEILSGRIVVYGLFKDRIAANPNPSAMMGYIPVGYKELPEVPILSPDYDKMPEKETIIRLMAATALASFPSKKGNLIDSHPDLAFFAGLAEKSS